MKKLVVAVVMVLGLASVCFADVTAEIIGVDLDENGAIRVKTQYKIDGKEVESRYPQQDGKYYFVTRYRIDNFAGMNKTKILQRIKSDISSFQKNIILNDYFKKANDAFVKSGADLINITNTEKTATLDLDTDNDGIPDTRWIIENGTKTEQSIL